MGVWNVDVGRGGGTGFMLRVYFLRVACGPAGLNSREGLAEAARRAAQETRARVSGALERGWGALPRCERHLIRTSDELDFHSFLRMIAGFCVPQSSL